VQASAPKLPVKYSNLNPPIVEIIARPESRYAFPCMVKFERDKGPDVLHVVIAVRKGMIRFSDKEVLEEYPIADFRKERIALLEHMSIRWVEQMSILAEESTPVRVAIVLTFSPREISEMV
jgi:hypothetical protein